MRFRTSKLWRTIGEFEETKGKLAFIRSGKKWVRVEQKFAGGEGEFRVVVVFYWQQVVPM